MTHALNIRMSEAAAVETEIVLEEALAAARQRLEWYARQGKAGSQGARSCRQGERNLQEAIRALAEARLKGHEPLWPEARALSPRPASESSADRTPPPRAALDPWAADRD